MAVLVSNRNSVAEAQTPRGQRTIKIKKVEQALVSHCLQCSARSFYHQLSSITVHPYNRASPLPIAHSFRSFALVVFEPSTLFYPLLPFLFLLHNSMRISTLAALSSVFLPNLVGALPSLARQEDPQKSLSLDPSNVMRGLEFDGQGDEAVQGQVRSKTSSNNL